MELLLKRIRQSMAERELSLNLSEEARDLLVDKGWDPAMGARPLRRAIQRYIEDPLADEVLRQGEMTPGSTVMVSRNAAGDEEDKPLALKIIAPKKPKAKAAGKPEREKVGVGANETRCGLEPGVIPYSSSSFQAPAVAGAINASSAARATPRASLDMSRH